MIRPHPVGVLDGQRILSPATVRYMTADHLGSIGVYRVGRSGELLPPGHGFDLGVPCAWKRALPRNMVYAALLE